MEKKMSEGEEKNLPFSLGLEDGNEAEEQPRRFLRLPSGYILAYGGENGNVSCLQTSDPKNDKFVIVQRYEDAVRCIAVSEDEKRLAIGFDTGKTLIYCFDEFVQENQSQSEKTDIHPYVQSLEKVQNKEESPVDDFLSQDCITDDNDLDSFAGPDLGAPARDMLFIPQKDSATPSSKTYMLAIASEAGMFVMNVTTKDIMDKSDHLLEEESRQAHDFCGIRGFSAGTIEARSSKSSGSSNSTDEVVVLASLAMDGRLCLWDFTNKKLLQREDTICVPKKDYGEIHDADAYDRSCRPIAFSANTHDGIKKELIISTPGKLIPCTRILNLTTEDSELKLSNGFKTKDPEMGHIQPVISMIYCSENMLVTSGRDGCVLVWHRCHFNAANAKESSTSSVDDNPDIVWDVVEKFKSESPVTNLIVQQYQNTGKVSLFCACGNGNLQIFDITEQFQISKSVGRKMNPTNKKLPEIEKNDETNQNDNEKFSESTITPHSSESSSKATKILKKGRFSADSDEDDEIDVPLKKSKNVHFLEEAEENNDENPDDVDPEAATSSISRRPEESDHSSDEEDADSFVDHKFDMAKQARLIDITTPQPAFSPSSTPLDLERRFLCWNHIGSVTLLQGDNNRNVVDINFADSASRRPISFTDNINFITGSVGECGGIFASDTKEDDDDLDEDIDGLEDFNMSERTKQAVIRDRKKRAKASQNLKPTGSSIFFYRFFTSNLVNRKNKDWHLVLPDGERVLGSACGDGWAAVVTSRKFLRTFSPGGNQNQIIWLKGEPVTMVGRGGFLAVFYHESSPLVNKTQQLGYTLWDMADLRVVSRGSVSCLSRGSSLSWVGFSNDLSLMVMDSDGMLSMLFTTGQDNGDGNYIWEWTPVLDTIGLRKSSDDSHWPVTVHNGKLVCIPLKGGKTYPDANRRPVTTMLGLRMPLAKSVVSKNSALEELSVRSNIALSQKNFVRELEGNTEELEREYKSLCAQVDKVTLRLFSGMVDAGKLESAFDLVSRLHTEKSFDIAVRLADRQYKLADEIDNMKKIKFPDDDYEYDEDNSKNAFQMTKPMENHFDRSNSKQISPDSRRTEKRSNELNEPISTENKRFRMS